MEATKEMEALLKRIYMPSVFYFPKALFPNLSAETKKMLMEYRFFEDIGIIKTNEDIRSLRIPTNALEIYKKDNVLEGNLFQLLEMKDRLGRESFRFLFDKYLSNVKAWIFGYKRLLENFDSCMPKTSKNKKIFFEYQCRALDDHLIKLNQKFQFNFKNTKTTNLIDVLSKHKSVFPFNKSIHHSLIRSIEKNDNEKERETKKPIKKQLLLTEKEADEFLLKTVFNVKTDHK
ncbi:hypothetical protein [Hwangdonia sp.]|uniref:hypothetical protein n=1 Tax=Hwangdonia sp. TaxID=1883432 RepID=UPI003AB84021